MLAISNRPRASRSSDFEVLARLLPELYSTRSKAFTAITYFRFKGKFIKYDKGEGLRC